MRLHPEGSVGAEAAPRTPCGKHCQRWCSAPPPTSRQESSSSDTNFIKHNILMFHSPSGVIFYRFAEVSMYISNSSLAYFAYAASVCPVKQGNTARARKSTFLPSTLYLITKSKGSCHRGEFIASWAERWTRVGSLNFDSPPLDFELLMNNFITKLKTK
ncbi:hypothetical protein ALC62_04232 [Cyphomyrmex costatus]|uniref:Uncharacterized protein n=1 Tax=Cyphomyrmex costatus TaxID=456900 RepID=A0A195CVY8_9HYME|nr:hypothetical protein ALC62_04232 [Cyphomyrmex costatus]